MREGVREGEKEGRRKGELIHCNVYTYILSLMYCIVFCYRHCTELYYREYTVHTYLLGGHVWEQCGDKGSLIWYTWCVCVCVCMGWLETRKELDLRRVGPRHLCVRPP